MKNMKKTVCVLLTSIVSAFAAVALIGCQSDDNTDKAVEWTVDERATVSVEGYTGLPSTIKDGNLTFTVRAAEGYGNVEVKVLSDSQNVNADIYRRIASDRDGKYSVKVKADSKVFVTVEELVEKVEIVQEPETMTYYAGEKLNAAGMEVKVTYATGRSEAVSDYEVVYTEGVHFSLGDTSFAVSYGGVVSEQKKIEKVLGRIYIQTDGGTIDASLIRKWEQDGYDVRETSEDVTLYYDKMPEEDFVLPENEMISHGGEEGDFVLSGWTVNNLSKNFIPKEWTAQSVNVRARFVPHVVDLHSVRYEYRTVGEASNTLCLVFRGAFRGADSVRLHLYEGNSGNTLKGYSLPSNRGETFEYVYDVSNIVNAGWKGLLVDVSFEGKIGSETVLYQVDLNDYADNKSFIDLDQTITEGDYDYSFQTVESNGVKKLAVKYTGVSVTTYQVTVGQNASGDAQMTVTGKLSKNYLETYSGKTVRIDALSQANDWKTYYYYSEIDQEGNWKITIEFTPDKFETGCAIYTHFAIVETADTSKVIAEYGDTPFDWCTNTDLDASIMIGDISDGAIAAEGNGKVFYIGRNSYSGGLIAYGTDK